MKNAEMMEQQIWDLARAYAKKGEKKSVKALCGELGFPPNAVYTALPGLGVEISDLFNEQERTQQEKVEEQYAVALAAYKQRKQKAKDKKRWVSNKPAYCSFGGYHTPIG